MAVIDLVTMAKLPHMRLLKSLEHDLSFTDEHFRANHAEIRESFLGQICYTILSSSPHDTR